MEDFIYLIALIAWVAFAFYRKSQKKAEAAQKEQQQSQPRDITSPFPSMKDIFSDEPSLEVLTAPVLEAGTTDGTIPVLEETDFAKEYKRSGISSVEELGSPFFMNKVEVTEIQEDEISEESGLDSDWRTKVDLRQAVIYSEILNRPYV